MTRVWISVNGKMGGRGFLHRTCFLTCDRTVGSQALFSKQSLRFLTVSHNGPVDRPPASNNGNDGQTNRRWRRPNIIRHMPSERLHLMEQLDDIRSMPTVKSLKHEVDALKSVLRTMEKRMGLQPTSNAKEPLAKLSGAQIPNLLRAGVKADLTAKEVSQSLFTKDGDVCVNPVYLRDACDCRQCVDPSTRQRNYSFVDIPIFIKPVLKQLDGEQTYHVSWEHDVPGFDDSHTSSFHASRIEKLMTAWDVAGRRPRTSESASRQLWDKTAFLKRGCWVEYEQYMNDASSLKSAVSALRRDGLIFVKNVPPQASSVSKVAERIGPLRNTFYGPTWDVRSVADAKNVAYTSKYLGFHMDLLYMDSPPEFQLLHCIHNSCAGGESRFVDTYKAAKIMHEQAPEMALALRRHKIRYTYDNDGHYYTNSHRLFNPGNGKPIWFASDTNTGGRRKDGGNINWSPEFMDVPGIEGMHERNTERFLTAARMFAETLEREDLVYQVKMDEGTCVIFENRRVAHARNAFTQQSGERWLRGAYLDYDVFWSKYDVLGLAHDDQTESSDEFHAAEATVAE